MYILVHLSINLIFIFRILLRSSSDLFFCTSFLLTIVALERVRGVSGSDSDSESCDLQQLAANNEHCAMSLILNSVSLLSYSLSLSLVPSPTRNQVPLLSMVKYLMGYAFINMNRLNFDKKSQSVPLPLHSAT